MILIISFFLFILFTLEKSLAKPRVYLKTVLFIALFISLLDELTHLKQYDLVLWFYPFIIGSLFSIYPIIYLYSRNLVLPLQTYLSGRQGRDVQIPLSGTYGGFLNGRDDSCRNLLIVTGFPVIISIFTSLLFYPLDYNSKIRFIDFYYTESPSDLKEFKIFQYCIIPAYYLQTTIYMILSLKLISAVRKNINSNPWKILLTRYILVYVVSVIIYESLLIINAFIMADNIVALQTIEMLLTLLFISEGLYIGFKQSLILLQSRLNRYFYKLEIGNNKPQLKNILNESEKKEIKEAIENYFHDSKIYLDPNLKLEHLSRKVHIPVKKISYAINEIYGNNFISFINDFRISEAKKIMLESHSDIKIDDVYTKVGFNSRSTFNRVFKSVTGITPAEYLTKNSLPS